MASILWFATGAWWMAADPILLRRSKTTQFDGPYLSQSWLHNLHSRQLFPTLLPLAI
jgi:hypothetical protein